jgi:uncharacterized protein (DUF302 family)
VSTYGFSVTLNEGYAQTVQRARTALTEQGFGVLTEIDVSATMKAKLGKEMPPYVILGACNPPLAHQALMIDTSIGLLLPCNVVVRALDEEHTLVEAMDPDVMVKATEEAALRPVADEARTRLTAALASLGGPVDQVRP